MMVTPTNTKIIVFSLSKEHNSPSLYKDYQNVYLWIVGIGGQNVYLWIVGMGDWTSKCKSLAFHLPQAKVKLKKGYLSIPKNQRRQIWKKLKSQFFSFYTIPKF